MTRRQILAAAFAQQFGPPPHPKGPRVFLDYDQVELDAAYNQTLCEPNLSQISARFASNSDLTRTRFGPPKRIAYETAEIEKLDIFGTPRPKAPVLIFIHGGAWRSGLAKEYAFPAEVFVNAGAHYVVPDFNWVQMWAATSRRSRTRSATIAWVHRKCRELRRRPRSPLSRGPFLGRAPRRPDHRMEPARSHQRRPVHQRHLRSETRAALRAQFLREARRCCGRVSQPDPPRRSESLANPYGLMGRAALRQMGLA